MSSPDVTSQRAIPSGWDLPDTEICTAAWQFVFDVSAEAIANHCVRSYLFARELAAAGGLRSGVDYDDEVVFLACVLHDLGVTAYGEGDQRFEVEGADAAVRFLHEQGVSDHRATTVWQAIALHTSLGLAHRFGPEQSVVFNGIRLDIDGVEKGRLSTDLVERINATWPRHDVGYVLPYLIAEGARTNPTKAPPLTFPGHLHQLINEAPPLTFFDMVAAAPWGDQPNTTV